ncbi:MAG TPA: luciferase family protein [Verrucomicrobiae bacterium]|nr:luciferase family protein [Verrucomicrobiae bacterium]
MKMNHRISKAVEHELLSWPGVSAGTHRFGGREFRVRHREIGHLHGDDVADLPFNRPIRDELVAAGAASIHHHLPDSGWVSVYPRDERDVPALLALFRRNYERLRGKS